MLSLSLHTTKSLLSTKGCSGMPFRMASTGSVPQFTGSSQYDAIICGGGHNGLVSAAYLAKAGLKVVVLERRHLVGGAAVTEELYPGFKFSRGSYLQSLFRPRIIQELKLKDHGLKFYMRNPSSFTPTPEGNYLMMGGDMQRTIQEIAKFSKKDAEAYPKYEHLLEKLSAFFNNFLDEVPPEITGLTSGPLNQRLKTMKQMYKLGTQALRLGKDFPAFWEIMTAPATHILNRWFESEPLKGTLATDAVIGAMISPSTPGSGYVLFHHVMGETDGVAGAWSYVEGGMGAISKSIASAAQSFGAEIRTNSTVSNILVENNRAVGVKLADGTILRSKVVLSNATPKVTFLDLLSSGTLPTEFERNVRGIDYTSPVTKINIAMDRVPNFKALPLENPAVPGPQHRGTIHFSCNVQEVEDAYNDAVVKGIPSTRPMIEMTIPSVLDPTVAPPGKHVASLFVQYTPYHLKDGSWNDPGRREKFAESVFNVIEEYCPGFKSSVLYADILTPPDLEKVFGLTGGNIFHGSMGLNQLFWLRPAAGFSSYKTPINGLYLCGAGAHPGGGVMGAPGRNCSEVVIEDQKWK